MEGDSSILNLMASAGLGGAVVGTAAKALSPSLRQVPTNLARLRALSKAGLTTGALTAGLVGLGGAAGQAIMGQPTDQEISEGSPWTRRAALGGALGGGLLGAGLGAVAGSGTFGKLARLAPKSFTEAGTKVISELPTENVIADYFRRLGQNPGLESSLKGAALGALGLGGVAGYLGADEGMQADVLDDERRALMRRRMGV